jgi:thiol:disulfide interchange protein DsbD
VLLGGAALFSLAAGMSVPLLLVGLSAGSLLPRAGAWMEQVKRFFGVLLLAVALWMVSPVLPAWGVMVGWALLLICVAVGLRAFDGLAPQARWPQHLGKGLGMVLALVGAAQLVGALSGGRDALQPWPTWWHCATLPRLRGTPWLRRRRRRASRRWPTWPRWSRRWPAATGRCCWMSRPTGARPAARWSA